MATKRKYTKGCPIYCFSCLISRLQQQLPVYVGDKFQHHGWIWNMSLLTIQRMLCQGQIREAESINFPVCGG